MSVSCACCGDQRKGWLCGRLWERAELAGAMLAMLPCPDTVTDACMPHACSQCLDHSTICHIDTRTQHYGAWCFWQLHGRLGMAHMGSLKIAYLPTVLLCEVLAALEPVDRWDARSKPHPAITQPPG